MPRAQEREESPGDPEDDRPGERGVSRKLAELAREVHEPALRGDTRDAPEGAAQPDELRLRVAVEREHVEAVGGDVVRRGAEGHEPEHGERELEETARGKRERDEGERNPE